VTYIRRVKIPSHIYAKWYRQESQYGSTMVIYPAIITKLHSYHRVRYKYLKNIRSLRSKKGIICNIKDGKLLTINKMRISRADQGEAKIKRAKASNY